MEERAKLTDRQQQILDLGAKRHCPHRRAADARGDRRRVGLSARRTLPKSTCRRLARKGVIELIGGTSRGIRLQPDALKKLNQMRGKQFLLPLPSLSQLNLPLVGRVAAGSPILAQEHIDQTYVVEATMFPRRPDYLLRVRGMSMRDAGIMDGDLLAVKQSKDASNGQIIVARIGDEVTVKRFKRVRNTIELHAENPDFEPIIVKLSDAEVFAIEGLAVGLIRNTMLM